MNRYERGISDAVEGGIWDELPIVQLWLMRAFVDLNLASQFQLRNGEPVELFAQFVGLTEWVGRNEGEIDRNAISKEIRSLRNTIEKKVGSCDLPPILAKNIETICQFVDLSQIEKTVFAFGVLVHTNYTLNEYMRAFGDLPESRFVKILSLVLGVERDCIKAVISPSSTLSRCGFLNIKDREKGDLEDKFELLTPDFGRRLVEIILEPNALLKGLVGKINSTSLSLKDYRHIESELKILLTYLRSSFSERRRGVNILFYGPPGTGKTELCTVLSHELGRSLYYIADEDEAGEPLTGNLRFRAYAAAQTILSPSPVLLLFDEVEDVFSESDFYEKERKSKSWINRLLENNTAPTIWACNATNGIDPAFARRFDFVLEIGIPNIQQRKEILNNYCGGLVGAEAVNRWARHRELSPAVVGRAARVAACVRGQDQSVDAVSAIEVLMSNTLRLQGHCKLVSECSSDFYRLYDLNSVNADTDLEQLVVGVTKHLSARLCLYGPPGTGKTAFGSWLAQEANRPYSVKRASDLVSMWVGGTEKNIARAFEEASDEGSVLQLDEIDSFLQDRRGAKQSWEISAVNEMLAQLEKFEGVFIASTNLMDGLDQASLRRFDQKIKFGYLKSEQAIRLLKLYCEELAIREVDDLAITLVERQVNLAPGDFAAIARSHRFNPIRNSLNFAQRLEKECLLKPGVSRSIGFIR